MTILAPPKRVLIVGSGEYGSSTALSLIKGTYKNHGHLITMLDRSAEPPAMDAASYDFNKIIRQEYSDEIYARLAHKAMDLWRTPEWQEHYHETGVVVSIAKSAVQSDYIKRALAVNSLPGMQTEGKDAYILETADDVKKVYPDGVALGEFADQDSYINEAGGWGHSHGAVVDTIRRLRAAGVRFVGAEAEELLYGVSKGKIDVRGVRAKDGSSYCADFVLLTMGAWTPKLVPELASELLPTGQVVGVVKLNREELKRYKDVPVTRTVDNGFYIFPPTEDGIVKCAIHQQGYLNPIGDYRSLPRTILTPGYERQHIPQEAADALKAGLARVYPELAQKPWSNTRLCWYSDRPSGDWLIDYHPKYPSLFIAAGCCGHAFKFMPILGDLILSSVEGTLPPEQKAIWAYDHQIFGRVDASRTFYKHKSLVGTVEALVGALQAKL
ncbi:hypothetical protein I302_106386 [Kwoniella bestiolae CBS 10118]|uniref:FAD dependent oxidoreductase domain-containing protein n=1 Tax=Kwoniella bestiolae CBS 10118 TaxID=1296100 RepID=A0AAJ8KBM8_9TREE